jgi:hypothetical protein
MPPLPHPCPQRSPNLSILSIPHQKPTEKGQKAHEIEKGYPYYLKIPERLKGLLKRLCNDSSKKTTDGSPGGGGTRRFLTDDRNAIRSANRNCVQPEFQVESDRVRFHTSPIFKRYLMKSLLAAHRQVSNSSYLWAAFAQRGHRSSETNRSMSEMPIAVLSRSAPWL